ncbi:hypothetical protein GCM10009559_28830 [Pseudonocardia zijingensis]|uniref:Uncharacterized protein n=1 Tax=Pseudonocardia zijingensis TaxID=153376 RepID=A0ABN1Q2A6_9PSEU
MGMRQRLPRVSDGSAAKRRSSVVGTPHTRLTEDQAPPQAHNRHDRHGCAAVRGSPVLESPACVRVLRRPGVAYLDLDGDSMEVETAVCWRAEDGSPTIRAFLRSVTAVTERTTPTCPTGSAKLDDLEYAGWLGSPCTTQGVGKVALSRR